MSELCSVCGELHEPCLCSRSDRTLLNELKRRGYVGTLAHHRIVSKTMSHVESIEL